MIDLKFYRKCNLQQQQQKTRGKWLLLSSFIDWLVVKKKKTTKEIE